jgi:23S rRNA-/tRNA-specific pseudouridylate synthase
MYHALIVGSGNIPEEIFTPIDGKDCHTSIKVIHTIPSLSNDKITLVSLIPHTGRTHQLRIHCADAGFPILGDPLYGKPKSLLKGKGLFLCSTMVSFIHPSTGNRIEVFCPIPAKFTSFLDREKRRALL